MCAYSVSVNDVIERITEKLYPFIDAQFDEVLKLNKIEPIHLHLIEKIKALRIEFDSLKNYEKRLVFPAVLEIFNAQKKSSSLKSSVNIAELQQLIQRKENLIHTMVNDVFDEAMKTKKSHPIHSIIYTLKNSFKEEKEKWNVMVNEWNKNNLVSTHTNNVKDNQHQHAY
ncbi:MAG: hypothetical protein JSR09_11245 [Bacteroidetes bacterium]|nr:hypothetical protein [Bacteroidota bacterium]MBS1650267.1 hypothetical protein [Bacteroidota bacterium]